MGTKLGSIFLIGAKFTKFHLALQKVMKNRSKLVKELSVLFLIIWKKKYFGVKVLMETPLDSNFSTHNNYLVTAPGTIGRTNQKVLRYDQRPSYMIRSDWRILIFVKSLMGTKLGSIFFRHCVLYVSIPFLLVVKKRGSEVKKLLRWGWKSVSE